MTKETHFQITATPSECVTPNVPRIRASFFNRKFRDQSGGSDGHTQLTPTTPKVNNCRTKVSSSTRSRSRRSEGSTSGSTRVKTRTPKNGRPSRSRPNNNEFYDQDFSTPRPSRSILTPPKTTKRVREDGRISHLVYQPLELDNESSSEPSDTYLRINRQPQWRGSPRDKSPLAIEAPNAEVTLTIFEKPDEAKPSKQDSAKQDTVDEETAKEQTKLPMKQLQKKETKVIETICISDSEDSITHDDDKADSASKRKCEPTSTQDEADLSSPVKKPRRMLPNGSPYMSHPDTPPDEELVESKTTTKPTKFIPGNCNIDDILSLCAKTASSTNIKEKDDNKKSSGKEKVRSIKK